MKFTPAASADCSVRMTIESDDLKHPTVDITLTDRGVMALLAPRGFTAVGAPIGLHHSSRALVARSDGTIWNRHPQSVYQQVHWLSARLMQIFRTRKHLVLQGFASLGGVFRPPRTRYEIAKASRNSD